VAAGTVPRAVLVTRPTELDRLVATHGTRGQGEFFLRTRGQSLAPLEQRHARFEAALHVVLAAIPVEWRRNRVDRADLDRFLFEPDDLVLALGQDGLVANVAKYLDGQPVIGLNPDPGLYEGVLVRHPPEAAPDLLRTVAAGRGKLEARTMVEARLDDGQRLLALNEVFVGHRSHQSARYRLTCGKASERHSSSGVIVATGTGATGWARSIQNERAKKLALPGATAPALALFVREAWPSVATQTALTAALVSAAAPAEIVSEMDDDGTVFGDGIETDRLDFAWGKRVTVAPAATRLHLLVS
jgi:hypothetical protein